MREAASPTIQANIAELFVEETLTKAGFGIQIVAVFPSNEGSGEHLVPSAKELHVYGMHVEDDDTHAADFILQAT